ncbi:MAG: hypothetical protein HY318_13125 [Armatimonadetes bacterium]|nr:hypothetical protein [Armatimonadota bacterium]
MFHLLLSFLLLRSPVVRSDEIIYGSMRNGSFDEAWIRKTDEAGVTEAVKAGWTLPKDLIWAGHWGPNPNTGKGTIEYVRQGGRFGSPCMRLDGGGHIASYFGNVKPQPYIASIWVKGKGTLWFGGYLFGDAGQVGGATFARREVHSDVWVEYRGVFPNDNPEVKSVNPAVGCTGPLEVEDAQLMPAEPVEVALVTELTKLYGTGAVVEDREGILIDKPVQEKAEGLRKAQAALKVAADKDAKLVEPKLLAAVLERVTTLTANLTDGATILPGRYNDIVAMTQVCLKLAKAELVAPGIAQVTGAPTATGHRAGIRDAKPDTVTIVLIRPTKLLYAPNENAQVTLKLHNTSDAPQAGTLRCFLVRDIEVAKPIYEGAVSIPPKQITSLPVVFNVGPENFGRAVRAQFLQDGKVVDEWEDYFHVADEFILVHMGTGFLSAPHDTTFFSMYTTAGMYFARMPSDFGYGAPKENKWLSGQAMYQIDRQLMINEIAFYRTLGLKCYNYRNPSFCGQAGYEIARRHPEWVLREKQGRFATDAVYGGVPSPLQIASPIEIDPTIVGKDSRKITSWHHGSIDFFDPEAVRYGAEDELKSIDMFGWDGIFFDGRWAVWPGYKDYAGQPNDHGQNRNKLNLRNQKLFNDIVREKHPNYSIWYNWGGHANPELEAVFHATEEEFAFDVKQRNAGILLEATGHLNPLGPMTLWRYDYDMYLKERDTVMQRYGVPVMTGWLWRAMPGDQPGPSRWAWVATNHLGALLIATQTHEEIYSMASFRPTAQFQTRYSSLLWARDVKVLPKAEMAVSVKSPRPLWWKEVVYTRKTAEGTDYIIHLIHVPESETILYDNPTDPPMVQQVQVTIKLPPTAKPVQAWAMRPYDFGEPQRPVEKEIPVTVKAGVISVTVPDFRYHSMVVVRVK